MGNAKLKDDLDESLSFSDELAPGSKLMHGQYTIEAFINAGGFGITYSARDSLDRKVVIKECFPGAFCRRSTALVTARSRAHQSELASIVRLFVQEARSLAKLNHPNIVGVHQVFEENNTAYMALDLVEGRDLLDVIEAGKLTLTPPEVESILRKILDAIGFVHTQGLLHRDISPDNILIDKDKNPVLIDFGAAREQASKKSRVLSALRVVKDGYSPQEFYISGSEQGPYSDLYALGATFYHLITGQLPPDAQTRLSAVASGDPDPYRPLANRAPTYRKGFLESLDKAMEILPKNRIADAEQWLLMLDGAAPAAKPAAVAKGGASKKQEAAPKSNKSILLASGAIIAVIATGVVVSQSDMFLANEGAQTSAVAAETPEVNASVSGNAAPAVVVSAEPVVADADALDVSAALSLLESVVAAPEQIEAPSAPAVDAAEVAPDASSAVVAAPAVAEAIPEVETIAPEATVADAAPVAEVMATAEIEAVTEVAPVEAPAEAAPVVQPEVAAALAAFARIEAAAIVEAPAEVTEAVKPEIEAALAAFAQIEATSQVVPPAPAPEAAKPAIVLETFDVPGMQSAWSVALPDQGTVFAVNGTPVASVDAVDALLRETIERPESGELTVTLSIGETAADAQVEDWVLPVIQKTTFPGGLSFEARQKDGAWATTVVSVPDTDATGVAVGDVLFGHIQTTTLMNGRTTLPELAERAARGEIDLSFAVNRDGNTLGLGLMLGDSNSN
ncbi:serine/threonine protein kinase [uncultured Tateyamaria sp.]|uniref:serine/threonine-protein kinase n=1 Tax=uncultured Tateyamaria sp. TaxID=455651 RepID=UPI002634A8DB|nr:serine/threonine protein kinase [uncultured Tateyamaria sp.]